MKYPEHLTLLINMLKHLPGVGNRTAERYAFQMLEWPEEALTNFSKVVSDLKLKTIFCSECGCLIDRDACYFCSEVRKQVGIICIVPSFKEVFAIESTGEYKGAYHVLGGLLSPLEGVGPETLSIDSLLQRIKTRAFNEIIIGLDATLEGDATALYLKKELFNFELKVSRLAFGIPMGSSLDYVDGSTLARAFSGRSMFS